jgi:hypothetical protein
MIAWYIHSSNESNAQELYRAFNSSKHLVRHTNTFVPGRILNGIWTTF